MNYTYLVELVDKYQVIYQSLLKLKLYKINFNNI